MEMPEEKSGDPARDSGLAFYHELAFYGPSFRAARPRWLNSAEPREFRTISGVAKMN
jgi:hypothetical protein